MLPTRLFKIPILILIAAAVAFAGVLGRMAFRSVYDSGYQRGVDSTATAVDRQHQAALTQVKDSLLAERATLATRGDSAASSLHRDVSTINRRVDSLRAHPVPAVAVSPAVDSASRTPRVAIVIDDDTARYFVHPNVGHWIQLANIKLAQDDSVIGEQSFTINVRFPALLAMREGEIALLQRTNAVYDSLTDSQRDENVRLRRTVARLTPGTISKLERYALYALAGYGAYQGARRLAGS